LQEVVGINLANQTGREGKLSAAYADAASDFAAAAADGDTHASPAAAPGFRLVPFDFHKQCGATNYARLAILWEVSGHRRTPLAGLPTVPPHCLLPGAGGSS
jgi:hypothetical protein